MFPKICGLFMGAVQEHLLLLGWILHAASWSRRPHMMIVGVLSSRYLHPHTIFLETLLERQFIIAAILTPVVLVLCSGLQFLVSGLCLLDGAAISIIGLLMTFKVAAVEEDLLSVMQVVLEESLLVDSVGAMLV